MCIFTFTSLAVLRMNLLKVTLHRNIINHFIQKIINILFLSYSIQYYIIYIAMLQYKPR